MTTPAQWLKLRAMGFDALSRGERGAIKDFTFLWSLFEAQMLASHASAGEIERAVNDLAAAGRLDIAPLAPSLAYFRDRYWDGAEFKPAYYGLLLRTNDQRPVVEAVLSRATNDPSMCTRAMLTIIYRFRNNLFHGMKWQYGLQDQRLNFTHANKVMMALMDM